MSLYEVYNLLPPVPPTIFSRSDTNHDRARFPNFLAAKDPAAACRQSMEQIFRPRMTSPDTVQFILLACLLAVLLPAATVVIAVRIARKRFWAVRLIPTDSMPLLAFNSSTIFILFGGLGLASMVAVMVYQVASYGYGLGPMLNANLQYCWTWLPLFVAIVYSAWGLAHARTSDATVRRGGLGGLLRRHPLIANIVQISSPFLLAAPALVTSLLFNRQGEAALLEYERVWRPTYAESALSQEMLVEAQQLWYGWLDGYYWIALAMVLWTAVLPIAYAFHHYVLLTVMRDLRQSLRSVGSSGDWAPEVITVREDEKEAAGFYPRVFIPRVTKTPTRKLLLYVTCQYWAIAGALLGYAVIAINCAVWLYDAAEHARIGDVEPPIFFTVCWAVTIVGYVLGTVIIWGDFEQTSSTLLLRNPTHSTMAKVSAKRRRGDADGMNLRILEETVVHDGKASWEQYAGRGDDSHRPDVHTGSTFRSTK